MSRTHLPRLTIGIRREDPRRIWERRAPLTPDHVHHLVSEKNVQVHVQPCNRRVFPVTEYLNAGATIQPCLTHAHIIVGIKETPLDDLITSPVPFQHSSFPRTHLMFSHTVKGQPYNTPLLARFLPSPTSTPASAKLLPRLVDYELLTNDVDGKRTVGFGFFAGLAGVLESLSAMAHAHLEMGVASPFLYTPRPHTMPSLAQLRVALREIGAKIIAQGTPKPLGPFLIGLTGNGNVAQGSLSILSELPIQLVSVNDLDTLVRDPSTSLHKIYLVHAKPEDYLVRSDGKQYDRESYYASPNLYHSVFCEKVAPYLTLFLNGVGWSEGFPRLMTNEQLVLALRRARELGGARFTNIGDIACDVGGGLEFMTTSTTLSSPIFKVRSSDPSLPEVQVMSVDILPTAIPLDASRHFSTALMPYLERAMGWYAHTDNDPVNHALGSALERATVAVGGALTEKHRWLQQAVDKWYAGKTHVVEPTTADRASLKRKRVLMLGSGMVTGPAVDHIAQRRDVDLLVASNMIGELQSLTKKHDNATYKVVNMNDESALAQLIAEADVVISLLPVALHTRAAELCIAHHKHLITASYISPAMRALHTRAAQSGVLLLNEIGLDPGIDHCSTHALMAQFKRDRKRVLSFSSFCGGFPAPEAARGVPLSYKFSWTPRGVLGATLNGARFKLAGETKEVEGTRLLRSVFPNVPVPDVADVRLEGLPNRDSLPYADVYGLGALDAVRTVLRGTLRYPGFASLMEGFRLLGLLEANHKVRVRAWEDLVSAAVAARVGDEDVVKMGADEAVRKALAGGQDEQLLQTVLEAGQWLGIVPGGGDKGPKRPMPSVPEGELTPIDLFAALLGDRLRYDPVERDMVVLSHEFVVAQEGRPVEEEVYTSSLVAYGDPSGHSAMARTVGIPVAIAALMVLDGKVGPAHGVVGVVGPSEPSVYQAVLEGLEKVGLGMTERKLTGPVKTVEQTLVDSFRQ
ncbi:hypothetical protein APHAL10511_003109 [Amanita phalloides]|nr:hypothetical protein APHAL10511_003109 [Amanita phalloides]